MNLRHSIMAARVAAILIAAFGARAEAQNLDVKGTITGEGNAYFYQSVNVPYVYGLSPGTLSLKGQVASSGSAVAIVIDNTNSLSAGKVLSLRNAGTEKSYIDYNGNYCMVNGGCILPTRGLFVKRTAFASGSGTFTTQSTTHTLKIQALGAGGGGGGGASNGAGDCAGGGAAGAYAEKTFVVSPSTGYSYAVGSGGAGGAGDNNGGAGGSTTLTVDSTSLVCPGGGGSAWHLPGTGVSPTNADFATRSLSGNSFGSGGSSLWSEGGKSTCIPGSTGTTGGGPGAGGGGGTDAMYGTPGAAGGNGLLVIDEYT